MTNLVLNAHREKLFIIIIRKKKLKTIDNFKWLNNNSKNLQYSNYLTISALICY